MRSFLHWLDPLYSRNNMCLDINSNFFDTNDRQPYTEDKEGIPTWLHRKDQMQTDR